VGARLSARLVTRHGRHRVMIVSGWLPILFPLGLAFTQPGTGLQRPTPRVGRYN